jgi:hypothetical protein
MQPTRLWMAVYSPPVAHVSQLFLRSCSMHQAAEFMDGACSLADAAEFGVFVTLRLQGGASFDASILAQIQSAPVEYCSLAGHGCADS